VATMLKVQRRPQAGKYAAFNLRKQGDVPAVVYGRNMANINIRIPGREFHRVLHQGRAQS